MSWWDTGLTPTIFVIALVLVVILVLVIGKKLGPLKRIGRKGIEFGDPIESTAEVLNMESGNLEDHPILVKDLERHCDKVQLRIIEKLDGFMTELGKVEGRLCTSIDELKARLDKLEETVGKLLG